MALQVQMVVLSVLVAAVRGGGDPCAPLRPGGEDAQPWTCCKVDVSIPEDVKAQMEFCIKKYQPQSPPTEDKTSLACIAECLFAEQGLLTSEKSLNEATTRAYLSSFLSADQDMDAVMVASMDKCFASYKSSMEMEDAQQCKSGAEEFMRCLARENFLNCSSSLWQNDDPDCAALKKKVTECPKLIVPMH